jgi:very-short-patch-repair endonuclease
MTADLTRLDALVAKVAASGAPMWAEKLRLESPIGTDDLWTSNKWRKSWEWARAEGYLSSLGDRETVRELSETRAQAEAEQKKLFAEVVRLRTFLGLKLNLTNKVEAALAKFTAAIARLGKGTGKTAGRQRRIIREAAMDTAQAVPCWILPEWRVAEQLPADLAAFDLVIIDESSQSDITAFPAIMRGKKVLIVGDDKQVSPTVIGIEDRKIVQLRTTFLTGLPFADQMDPATSLYELGGMVFPGKAIMLREHFRCVEPIIRFSSRFYPTPLIPLRVPKASERLDPPLVDIYVPHGSKSGDLNKAEADIIVDEIAKLTKNPEFEKRSIGVISLIGAAQAKLIYDRLVSELGAEVVDKHRIMCGSSATFQGQERDVMFLSMVACPSTAMMQAERKWEQRFNVAVSRARDRLVLVRSVATSHLKPNDLKAKLIEHFRNPMEAGSVIRPKEVLDLCDSGFERDFGMCLLELGYRLKPQVPVGGYRIDFVVEGADDRRLAMELDGDKYHGPDKWAEDVRRQKALERLGWVFWRCWGSSWISDRQGCLDDLKSAMGRLGIEPLGMESVEGIYTLHIEASSPPTNDNEEPEFLISQSEQIDAAPLPPS